VSTRRGQRIPIRGEGLPATNATSLVIEYVEFVRYVLDDRAA
jgi:hypothetical protein